MNHLDGQPAVAIVHCPGIPDLAPLVTRLATALEDLMTWGVEHDDERINYISVQVDRISIANARAALKSVPVEMRRKTP